MYGIFNHKEMNKTLDELYNALLSDMEREGTNHSDFPEKMSYLERLHEMKTRERPNRISRDTLAVIIGNLAGILLIVAYEQKHVMTSKGFSHILKPKTELTH